MGDILRMMPNVLLDKVEEVCSKTDNIKLKEMFKNCFLNTLETTVTYNDRDAFVITGDIHAMWLRDSSAQIKHYIPYAKNNHDLQLIIKAVINRQIKYILLDPYANAFNKDASGDGHKDITDNNPWVWERKYEIDSLCYPIWIAFDYYRCTGEKDLFDDDFKKAIYTIINVFLTEQHHDSKSEYTFERKNCVPSDTLCNNGKGNPVAYTGMTWSGFRPSDDACQYGYLIPSNMMAVVILRYIEIIASGIYGDDILCEKAINLWKEIDTGIKNHGIIKHPKYGNIYAYEVDGFGNFNLMDDANVPSLLSIPYIGYSSKEDLIYQNTRRFILSEDNPYYYSGIKVAGIGSPHTPVYYIWHISLIIQGLTTNDQKEKEKILNYLLSTDGDTGYMHESFKASDPKEYTRSWFAWANSLFSEFVIKYLESNI